jgi:hypothetical protein
MLYGRARITEYYTEEASSSYRLSVDEGSGRLHGASVAGLVVGAMGVFVFVVALRHWLREKKMRENESPSALRALETGAALRRQVVEPLDRAEDRIAASQKQDSTCKYEVLCANSLRLACSRFDAICCLCDIGFLGEAVILMRSVFEIALQLQYVSTDPQGLAPEFEEHGRAWLYKYGKDLAESWPAVGRSFQSQPWYASSAKAQRHATFDNRADMAKEVDRKHGVAAMSRYYRAFYPLESELAHATAPGMLRRSGAKDFDSRLLILIKFGVWMFLDVVETANGALKLGLDDARRAAARELEAALMADARQAEQQRPQRPHPA